MADPLSNHQPPWYRVEVRDFRGQIVAIESEMLTGREIGDAEREVIETAIRALSGFIGRGYYAAECARISQLEAALGEERERCAKVAEALKERSPRLRNGFVASRESGYRAACENIATAIRALPKER